MNIIITLAFVLTTAYLFVYLGRRVKVPTPVLFILCGLFLNTSFMRNMFIEPNIGFLFGLGDIAIIFLMVLVGLESSWKELYSERKDSLFIALFASLFPLFIGLAVFLALGFSFVVSSIIGICISITAEGTTAKVLMEINKLKSKVGAAMIGAGIIDDTMGLSFFILITYFLKKSYLKEDLLIAGVVLAFFIGVLIQKNLGRENQVIKKAEKIALFLIVPFFFISIGIHFDIGSLRLNAFLLALIVFIAIIGKLIGTFLTKRFTKLSWRQLNIIGWAMNSRGGVEMVLALIAFRSGLIPIEIYSSLIIMTLITTPIFPFIMSYIIKKEPGIMD